MLNIHPMVSQNIKTWKETSEIKQCDALIMQDIFSRKETERNQQLGNQTKTTSFCNQIIQLT